MRGNRFEQRLLDLIATVRLLSHLRTKNRQSLMGQQCGGWLAQAGANAWVTTNNPAFLLFNAKGAHKNYAFRANKWAKSANARNVKLPSRYRRKLSLQRHKLRTTRELLGEIS
jgi:hypothetical protein